MFNSVKKIKMDKKTLIRFLILGISSQAIYSIWSLRGPLYNPFIQALDISNAQLGHLFTVMGLVGTFTAIIGGTIIDRFQIRKVLAINLWLTAVLGYVVATGPKFSVLLVIFCLLGLTTDGFFWYGVMKSIRVIASESKQGTAFGSLELVRGVTDITLVSVGVFIFSMVNEALWGIKLAIAINSTLMIIMGILTWVLLPNQDFLAEEYHIESAKDKNKQAIKGLFSVLKMPKVWFVGIQASSVYIMYIGMQYFVPFLQGVYSLPVLVVAVFGIVNTSGMRMIASPLSGLIGDNFFKASTKLMRVLLIAVTVFLSIILFLPKTPQLMFLSIISLVMITVFIYMLRGVYYAPIGEMGISKAKSGAALAVAGFIGYSPQFWAYSVFGTIIDKYESVIAYQKIFSIMFIGAILGIIISFILCHHIDKHKAELKEETN